MKKILLSVAFLGATFVGANAQELLNDNFDSYNIGDISEDFTGATLGQGDWGIYDQSESALSNFQFVAESGKGNVVSLTGTDAPSATVPPNNARYVFKGISGWADRETGNNQLSVSYEFYTGDATTSKNLHRVAIASQTAILGGFDFAPETKVIRGLSNTTESQGTGLYTVGFATGGLVLPASTWVEVEFILDYDEQTITWYIPSVDFGGSFSALSLTTDNAPAEIDFYVVGGTSNASLSTVLYDNLVISAIGTASVGEVVSSTFSVYPNPVKDVLNISNSMNAEINTVTVVDINGRTVKQFGSVSQINVSDLNAGVYFVNINSNEGSTTKKIVKQ